MSVSRRDFLFATAGALCVPAALASGSADYPQSARPDPRILRGDARNAFRDPAAIWHDGVFHLFFTWVEIESDGKVFSYCAMSQSKDLVTWTPPRKLTPRDNTKDFGSPGDVVRDGDEWVLCLQTYPRPGNVYNGKPRYGNADARLWTMRSKDLKNWRAPELLRVKGPDVPREKMGRMIDPYLLRAKDGMWWCFYKQNGASMSKSRDLCTWTPMGRTDAGENVCVVRDGAGWRMYHSPKNGIGVKTSCDLVQWTDEPGLITLGQKDWTWAKGRLTAGFVLDARAIPGVGGWLMFFHGSGPKTEHEGDFDCNASVGVVRADSPSFANWSTIPQCSAILHRQIPL